VFPPQTTSVSDVCLGGQASAPANVLRATPHERRRTRTPHPSYRQHTSSPERSGHFGSSGTTRTVAFASSLLSTQGDTRVGDGEVSCIGLWVRCQVRLSEGYAMSEKRENQPCLSWRRGGTDRTKGGLHATSASGKTLKPPDVPCLMGPMTAHRRFPYISLRDAQPLDDPHVYTRGLQHFQREVLATHAPASIPPPGRHHRLSSVPRVRRPFVPAQPNITARIQA
jgi:hypothetical protein